MAVVDHFIQGDAIKTGLIFINRILGIDEALGFLFRKFYYGKPQPVKNNKIFIMTYDRQFSCNPRYIVEELLRQNKDVEIVAACSGNPVYAKGLFPKEVKLVKIKSKDMFDAMATSKIWIDNALNCVWYGMPKSKGQYYINTWHGSLGIKKLGGDRGWMRKARKCDKITDYCITNSRFEENVFRETFWEHVPYLKCGHARNDIFFDEAGMAEKRKTVLEYFDIPEDKLVALYAPTFREESYSYEKIDFEGLKKALEKRFRKECVIIVRLHNKDRLNASLKEKDWLKQGTFFGDMQELLPGIDVGITDYSSWVYDYILTGKPIFLYVPDLEHYDQDRGFYYPVESTPFPVARTNSELSERIEQFDEAGYAIAIGSFLQDKGCYEDGRACERIVDILDALMHDRQEELKPYLADKAL